MRFHHEDKHRHTPISVRLRRNVIDAELRLQVRLASMQSWSSIHARSDLKFESVSGRQKQIYFDALSAIPYLTHGRTYEDEKQQERAETIRRYRAWQKRRGEELAAEEGAQT